MASFALYKASHPHFLTSSYHFYDITPTILDIVSTESVASLAHYWWYHTNWIFEISSAIYDDIISIVYDITATECVSSHPHFQRYNTLCIEDITPTICIISYTLYKAPCPHFMTSHHIFMTSDHIFMTSHLLYSWYHLHYIWNEFQYRTSHTWQYKHYICHLAHCI